MRTVFKYPLSTNREFTIELPLGARLLHIGLQENMPTLWAEVDKNSSLERRTFFCIGTGYDIPDNASYVGTIEQSGYYMWHYYIDEDRR